MARSSGNDLLVAASRHGEPLILTKEQRSRHLYVTGSTGSGKSKFLEYLIRQDILNWRKSGECGLLLLDPHGAIYDGLMAWLARTSHIYTRPVIPINRPAPRRLGRGVQPPATTRAGRLLCGHR
jgi:DNA helicase HerA-like ATPase